MIDKILVIDDMQMICDFMKTTLERHGVEVTAVRSGEEGVEILKQRHDFQMCFCDMRMGRLTGLDVLTFAKSVVPDIVFVIVTAHDADEMTTEAMKLGAFDCIVKPFGVAQVDALIERATEHIRVMRENAYLRSQMDFHRPLSGDENDRIFGNSYHMIRALQYCQRASTSDKPVLITGEQGTGKKLIADEVCRLGDPEKRLPRVLMNCAEIPEDQLEGVLFGYEGSSSGVSERRTGQVELADGGVLLLEAVSVIPIELQKKLIRFITDGTFERVGGSKTHSATVRIIAITRKPLRREVDLDHFLEELYYLLNAFPIELSPLMERSADIPVIAKKLLKRENLKNGQDFTFSAQALDRMQVYQWPCNVRELENVVQRVAMVFEGDVVTAEDLPNDILKIKPVKLALADRDMNQMFNIREIERLTIIRALKETSGNRTKTAELLGFTSRTLRNKLIEYDEAGIWDEDFDPKKRRKKRT